MKNATSATAKGRAHGVAIMLGMFFANLFDPKKIPAIEHVATQRRIGNDTYSTAQAAAAPPITGDGI